MYWADRDHRPLFTSSARTSWPRQHKWGGLGQTAGHVGFSLSETTGLRHFVGHVGFSLSETISLLTRHSAPSGQNNTRDLVPAAGHDV